MYKIKYEAYHNTLQPLLTPPRRKTAALATISPTKRLNLRVHNLASQINLAGAKQKGGAANLFRLAIQCKHCAGKKIHHSLGGFLVQILKVDDNHFLFLNVAGNALQIIIGLGLNQTIS